LPEAKDYKRIGESDTGLNTGGMGAVSPVPFADKTFMAKVEERIVKPTINGLKADNLPYKGFVFIGLMNVSGEPYVIEYNVRMGDPETEVVLPRIENDLLEILVATAKGELKPDAVQIKPDAACTVVAVSGGYPESYDKNKEISGLNTPNSSIVFHAGTLEKEGNVLSNGGRVLAVSSLANTAKEALEKSYNTLSNIHFDGIYYRKDIGKDLF
jgi:phosphoribosylamine--glycine ligase